MFVVLRIVLGWWWMVWWVGVVIESVLHWRKRFGIGNGNRGGESVMFGMLHTEER